MLVTGAIVAVNGLNPLSLLTLGIGGVLAIAPKLTFKVSSLDETAPTEPDITPGEFRIYRQAELGLQPHCWQMALFSLLVRMVVVSLY
ncbi:hypothetical protein [Nostoc favosum]|uniref:Uncharacterized protein n=1 Tax=Nostoc favosum CHAB5714 TaxID=2780399 RepID=A0ABS8ILR5_9NOSO|nr:hypothetical protein [Nostoc favosum]MCC5604819.1 hypothetical protein [Nostoc favosum CHAB5714]